MNDEAQKFSDFGPTRSGEAMARIILEGNRPELAACIDGLEFRAGEDPLSLLLRASILQLTNKILLGLHDEADLSDSIIDIEAGAARLRIAARSLRWELEKQGPPPQDLSARYAAYRAEILELLHGPPPLIKLGRDERAAVARRAAASLAQEEGDQQVDNGARQQLLMLVDDLELLRKSDFPYLVTRLPTPKLFEWMARWKAERSQGGEDATDGAVVQVVSERMDRIWIGEGAGEAILPQGVL